MVINHSLILINQKLVIKQHLTSNLTCKYNIYRFIFNCLLIESNLPDNGNPLSTLAPLNKELKLSSSSLDRTCIFKSIISDCCLNNIFGLSNCLLNKSLSEIFLNNGFVLSPLRRRGDIFNSPSFLSNLDKGARGGLPRGANLLGTNVESLMLDGWFSLSVERSSSSLSTFVSTRSRIFVFSSDVRSS